MQAALIVISVVALTAWAIATQKSVVLYITGLFAFGLVWAVAHALFGGLAAKVVVMPLPDRASSPYRDVRRGLVKAGATRKQARASAWATGPLTFVGIGVIGAAFMYVFVV